LQKHFFTASTPVKQDLEDSEKATAQVPQVKRKSLNVTTFSFFTFSAVHKSAYPTCLHFEHNKMRNWRNLFDPPYLHILAFPGIGHGRFIQLTRELHSACFGCGKVDNRSLRGFLWTVDVAAGVARTEGPGSSSGFFENKNEITINITIQANNNRRS